MVIVVNRLQFEAARPELEKGFLSAPSMTDRIPGCVGFEFWRNEGEAEYLVVTKWEDRASFEAWTQSEAFRSAHRNTRSAEGGSSNLGVYEVLRS
ncbi:MAG: antibiotic biosynthesis monooxygenase [Thermaerobacter sp.]|nr:antibiotic biosynthesis monooxygenase [Thermaerobacter sp.]